ncbi:MAG TPA: DNA polymerase III subunit [Vicinamibacterales bacterium]|nr:DNA polymerase III subunit [Vicinamibacterales bacterium]
MPFRDITGHERILGLIARAAVRGSLPPSLVFAGPSGVGKSMAAVALAQLVNCLSPVSVPDSTGETPDACGDCNACRKILRGVHPDVQWVRPEESASIKVDPIRGAIGTAGYRPFEGRRRVTIIDDADRMVDNAQDSLLKTLEEPPAASIFILVTSLPEMLFPTVRSRCQRLRFGRLAPGDVARILMERHEYVAADAHAAAALSDGSVGRALEGGTDAFREARDAALDLLQAVASTSAPAARLQGASGLPGAGRSKADRAALGQSLLAMSSILRDLGALMAHADERSMANADLKKPLEGLLRAYDSDRVISAFAHVDTALNALDRNASPKIVAGWLSLQI